MEKFTKKYRVYNPFRSDEVVLQEVVVSDTPQFDYSEVPWVAIDTEFLTLKLPYDNLCTIQIASPQPGNPELMNVEIIWVWEKLQSGNAEDIKDFLKSLLKREDLEILMHVFTADLARLEKIAEFATKTKMFDTKVAAKIAMTNTDYHGMDDIITALVDPRFTKDRRVTSAQWDSHPLGWDDKMIEYAMNDVVYLRALQMRLTELADRRGKLDLLNATMKLIPTISALYRNGYDEKVLGY